MQHWINELNFSNICSCQWLIFLKCPSIRSHVNSMSRLNLEGLMKAVPSDCRLYGESFMDALFVYCSSTSVVFLLLTSFQNSNWNLTVWRVYLWGWVPGCWNVKYRGVHQSQIGNQGPSNNLTAWKTTHVEVGLLNFKYRFSTRASWQLLSNSMIAVASIVFSTNRCNHTLHVMNCSTVSFTVYWCGSLM